MKGRDAHDLAELLRLGRVLGTPLRIPVAACELSDQRYGGWLAIP